jgi:glycosyltransferase involved in cell wall biosynthesis
MKKSSRRRRFSRSHATTPQLDHPDVVFTVTDRVSSIFVGPVAAELHCRGLRVGLITNFHGQPPPPAVRGSLSWHADLAMRRPPSPIHDLVALVRMTRLLHRARPAVVHASTPKAGLVGVIAGRVAVVPRVVFQVRGLRSEGVTGLNGRIQRFTEQVSLSLAHLVVIDSPSLRQTAVASGLRVPAAARVIGRGSSIGVDCNRFADIRSNEVTSLDTDADADVDADADDSTDTTGTTGTVTLGFVGRIHTDKGVADLIEVWDELSPRYPHLRMVVVGGADPTDPGSLALEAALASRPGIELAGEVDNVVPWLARMDVLVFASYREGLPNAPLEAQASGIPVVGYAATGTVDAVEHNTGGVLVPVGDRQALTDAVERLVNDPALRQQLGAAGQAFVRTNFDQAVVVAAHADFIEGLVRSAR